MNTLWKRIAVIALLLVAAMALMTQLVAADYSTTYLVSVDKAGVTEDGVEYDTFDIVGRESYDTGGTSADSVSYSWYKFFDGENYGLNKNNAINAISIETTVPVGVTCSVICVDALYLSFDMDARHIPGITPKVSGQDVVVLYPDGAGEATDGEFLLYFDGSDVGLTTQAEKIDGLDVMSDDFSAGVTSFPYDCTAGILFISTKGSYRVTGVNGALTGDGSDILMFCATNTGPDTAGFWFRGFDSSDVDMDPRNAMYGIDVDSFIPFSPDGVVDEEAAWLNFYFIVKGQFTAFDAFGGPSEVFGYPSCANGVYGPVDDFNDVSPALNGTASGFDIPNGMVTGDC